MPKMKRPRLSRKQFAQWGAIGGKKSKRKLTREQSLKMIKAREEKRKAME